jgi:hypothetical protein
MLTLGCMVRREFELDSYHREPTYIRSDSMAAVTKGVRMDMTGVRQEGYKRHGILLRRIFHARYGRDQMIEHVHGHPERRFQKGDRWQNLVGKEAGIFLADRAAKSNITETELETIMNETHTPILTARAKEVLIAISAIDLWCIMDSTGVPILECPRELIERERFRNYLLNRSHTGGKDYWTQYVDSAPAVVFPNHRLSTRQVKDTKLVFNWYMRAEHKQRGSAEERCQLCDKTMGGDTERHLYIECTHVPIDNCRREMLEDLKKMTDSIPQDTPNQKKVASALATLLTESEDRHLIWKGIITPAQVQTMEEALQWNKTEDQTKELEARDMTKTITSMIRRAGSMLQEIRTLTAAAGFLMPTPTIRVASLTTRQLQDKAMKNQQRIDQIEGWQRNRTARDRRDWLNKQSIQHTGTRQDIGNKRVTPSHHPQSQHDQQRETPDKQKDIRTFFRQGKCNTQDSKRLVNTDMTETQNEEETQKTQYHEAQDERHTTKHVHLLGKSKSIKNSSSTHINDRSIDSVRQEKQVTRRQIRDTNDNENTITERREINQNPVNTDEHSRDRNHVRTHYWVQDTHSMGQKVNTQPQNGKGQRKGLIWGMYVSRQGEEESDGQTVKKQNVKKVQLDVH